MGDEQSKVGPEDIGDKNAGQIGAARTHAEDIAREVHNEGNNREYPGSALTGPIKELQNRLQQDELQGTGDEPQPSKFDTIRWHMVDESPNETPSDSEDIKLPERKPYQSEAQARKEREEKLQEAADTRIEANGRYYLRGIIGNIRYPSDGLEIRGSNRPEQLNALIELLGAYGVGSESDEKLPQVMSVAISTVLAGIPSGKTNYEPSAARWTSIDQSARYGKVAEEIHQALKRRGGEIRPVDFDACVISALACGDPKTAVGLIAIADKILPTDADKAVQNSVSRLLGNNSIFKTAYELYPDSVKTRLNGVLATIGEGDFESLDKYPIAQKAKAEAEERLKAELIEDRDEWYASQKIAGKKNEEPFGEASLTSTVGQVAARGGDLTEIANLIQEEAPTVVDASVANILAAELARRFYPELSVSEQMQSEKQAALRIDDPTRKRLGGGNAYEALYGYDIAKGLDENEKRSKIGAVNTPEVGTLRKDLFDHNFNITYLVAYLKNPAPFAATLTRAIAEYTADARKESSYNSRVLENLPRIEAGRKLLAQKLIGGVNFLQAVAEDAEASQILERELGFTGMLNENRLRAANEQLQELFKESVEGKDVAEGDRSGISLYESMLEEGQLDEDTRVVKQLSTTRVSEIERLTADKTAETEVIVGNMVEVLQEEIAEAKLKAEQRTEENKRTQAAIEAVSSEVISLEKKLADAESAPIAGKLFNRGGLTQVQKDEAITAVKSELEEALGRKSELEKKLSEAQLDTVDTAEQEDKLANLTKLLPQQGEKKPDNELATD